MEYQAPCDHIGTGRPAVIARSGVVATDLSLAYHLR
jgi:hypothetical protein